MHSVSTELLATTFIAIFTGIIWIPIILNRLVEMGAWKALQNPEPDIRPTADWAYRLVNAHRNAIENLVVFAPLAIIVHVLQLGDGLTELAAIIFVINRVAHTIIYTFGIPLLRTIVFATGFGCQVVLTLRILGIA